MPSSLSISAFRFCIKTGWNTMKSSVFRIVCFLTILILVLFSINRVFKFKYDDGIYSLTKFYEQKEDSVDLLILGSSHAFAAFNTGVLWEREGIATYDLCGSMQPMWNTYYYFKEALKTQKPELVVLEAYMVTHDDDYIFYGSTIKNTFGMKLSPDKIKAVMTSVPKEVRLGYIMEYTQYHNRYREISESDFNKEAGGAMYRDWKGFMANLYIEPFDDPTIGTEYEAAPIHEKSEIYYRKILELAKNNNIPVLVVLTPYAGVTSQDMMKYERAREIASEYGSSFINYNKMYREIGIDYKNDVSDEGHLNYQGSEKFTNAFTDYLKDNYDLPDRRGSAGYESWENNAKYTDAKLKEMMLVCAERPEDYAALIGDDDCVIISCPEGVVNQRNLFDMFGITLTDDGDEGIWYRDMSGEDVLYITGEDKAEFEMYGHEVRLFREYHYDIDRFSNRVFIGRDEYNKLDGINITVYNKITDTVISDVGIDTENGNKLIR